MNTVYFFGEGCNYNLRLSLKKKSENLFLLFVNYPTSDPPMKSQLESEIVGQLTSLLKNYPTSDPPHEILRPEW